MFLQKSKRFFRKKELIDPDSEQEEEDGDSNVGIDEDGNGNNNEIGLGTAAVIRSTQVSSEIGKKQLDKKRSGQMMHESDNGRKEGDLGGVQGEDADDDSNEEDLDEEGEANPGVSDYDDIHLLISQQTRRVRNGGGRRRVSMLSVSLKSFLTNRSNAVSILSVTP